MQKRWISLLLVLALVLAVWSVCAVAADAQKADELSLIHISEPTRP